MKKGKMLNGLVAIVLIVSILLVGCSQGTENVSTNTNTSDETFNWRLASVWQEGTFLFEGDQRFAEAVTKLSNGRLTITAYGTGVIAPSAQVFDLVSNGTVECGGDWPSYWTGKNTAFDLLGSNVMGFSNLDYLIWIYSAGGIEDYNNLYGKYNLVYFPTAVSGMESGIRSTKKITTVDDLKGMKIRFAGLIQGELIQKFGVTPVTLAAHEVYEGLSRGVVDAVEYSAPINDEIMKLYEVAKYWLTPGWHQTSSIYGVMINKDAYNKLPDDLKLIIEMAAKAVGLEVTTDYCWGDAIATNKMLNEGVQTTQLSSTDLQKIEDAKNEVMEKLASENPDYADLAKKQMQYYKDYEQYRELLGEWSFGRTPTNYPNIK